MSELAPEEHDVLARARRGLSPSAGDAMRVRAGVHAAVAAGGDPLAGREPTRGPAAGTLGMAGPAKLGAVVALAAATGVGGYALGFRAGVAEREQRHPPLAAARAVVAPAPLAPASPVVTASLAAAATAVPAPNREGSSAARGARAERLASGALASAVAVPTPRDAPETSLELETRLLARVERALRDDNPRLALGLLGELERSVPGGQLAEERQAARAMAHCALGSDSAAKLARAFVDAHAASAYVPRVREACGSALEKKDAP